MKKDRHTKAMTIIVLFLACVGLTMGFLAFSTTFVVEPIAYVFPDGSDFKLVLYGYDYSKSRNPEKFDDLSINVSDPFRIVGAKSARQAKIDNSLFSISNLHATFTSPGQSVSYAFIIRNEGGCDAYLNSVKFDVINDSDLKKQCVGNSSSDLVNNACDDINLSVEVQDKEYFDNDSLMNSNIVVPRGGFIEFFVHISYENSDNRVDNELLVNFGDISLNFSTVSS